jgi:hypothetical protein
VRRGGEQRRPAGAGARRALIDGHDLVNQLNDAPAGVEGVRLAHHGGARTGLAFLNSNLLSRCAAARPVLPRVRRRRARPHVYVQRRALHGARDVQQQGEGITHEDRRQPGAVSRLGSLRGSTHRVSRGQ